MFVLFMLIFLLSFFAFFVIAIRPQLFKTTRKKGLLINLLVFILALIAVIAFEPTEKDRADARDRATAAQAETKAKKEKSFFELLTSTPTPLSDLTNEQLTIRLADKYNQDAKSQMNIYEQLSKRKPNNQKYKDEFKKFAKKVKVKSQFSGWDGSHRAFEKIIKASLKSPSSYKHITSHYWEYDDYIIVKTTYEAKNEYNANIREWARAKFDLDGKLLAILSTSTE